MLKERKHTLKKVNIEKIKSYEKNNKNHPDSQISLLVQIMDKYGQTNDVLLDEKYCEIICQRWEKLTNQKREIVNK